MEVIGREARYPDGRTRESFCIKGPDSVELRIEMVNLMDPVDPMDYRGTVNIIVSSSETIKSVLEQINFQINYPVTRQKLTHNGRKLHWTHTLAQCSIRNGDSIHVEYQPLEDTICSITAIPMATHKFLSDYCNGVYSSLLGYPSIELKQIMDHLCCWERIDLLLTLVFEICKGSMHLEEKLLHCIRKILKRPQPRDLQILIPTCVPATLSKLCQYTSPPEYNEVARRVFHYFLDQIASLPRQLHAECQAILMESYNLLAGFDDMEDQIRACRKAIKNLMLENRDGKFFDNLERTLNVVREIVCVLTYSIHLLLLDGLPTSPRLHQPRARSSQKLLSAGETKRNPKLLLEQDVDDLKAFSLALRSNYGRLLQGERFEWTINHRCPPGILLETMERCLQELEDLLSSNKTLGFKPPKQTEYPQYLIILEECYLISKSCKHTKERDFWKVLKSKEYALCWLIARYAEPKHDYMWLLKNKRVADSFYRRHLVMMNFPTAKKPDTEFFKMLLPWAKLLDDSMFSELKNQEESEFVEHFDSWLTLFCQAIFNPHNFLFARSQYQPGKFYPNPDMVIEPFHVRCFKFAGKIIALALLHQVDTGVVLHRVFVSTLVGRTISKENMQDIDPELHYDSRKTKSTTLIEHHFVDLISRQVEFFKKGLAEVLGESAVDLLHSLEPEDLDWILSNTKVTKPDVDGILYKAYGPDHVRSDRLMHRYKQHAVRGRNITDWEKAGHLGCGSCGSVYKAIGADGSIFAVKEVSLEAKENDTEAEKRKKKFYVQALEEEMNSLCQLSHPNIVKYLGTHRDELKLRVLLELVPNGSLVDIYTNNELQESQISSYTKSILQGLKYLHDQNVVHRDIKCANILVAGDGSIKLADFGLAKAIESNQGFKSYAGSLAWMAPEFFNNDFRDGGLIGIANDIWSFGCTVLEMFTRKYPYYGLNREQLKSKLEKGELPEIPQDLSENANNFITSCLQAYPSKRPTTAKLLQHPFVNSSVPGEDYLFHQL